MGTFMRGFSSLLGIFFTLFFGALPFIGLRLIHKYSDNHELQKRFKEKYEPLVEDLDLTHKIRRQFIMIGIFKKLT